jgi:HRDC domain./PIF1 helicase./Helicase.
METLTFKNKKLDFVNEIIQYTDSHIFLTGKAGTGKTTFLKNLSNSTYKRMVIVAPTGVAAINAGGVTIHSFFQLPFGPQIPESALKEVKQSQSEIRSASAQFQKLNSQKLKIIRSLDLLVIDEISMVRADVLDAIDAVLRRARHSDKAFGGVQLLMIGDVHQLAPVAKQEEWKLLSLYYDSVYFFSSLVLKKTPFVCVELEHIYRQHDLDFIDLLNKVRTNCFDDACVAALNKRFQPDFDPSDDQGYITLTTHNYQADKINDDKLNAIKAKELTFKASIEGIFPESSYPTKESLLLKVGAQVMFVKNDPSPEKRYYNGKIGKLVDYDAEEKTLIVKCDDDTFAVEPVKWQNFEFSLNKETNEIEENEIGSFTQIPLRLAWAITIHKSQGLTFDKLIIDANMAFAHGQVYVALSRCTSLQGLVLKSKIFSSALKNDYTVNGFVDKIGDLEPNPEKIKSLRHDFELTMMLDLFDFDSLNSDLAKLSKVVLTNDSLFNQDVISTLSARRKRLQEEILDVSKKFERQITMLHLSVQDCEENQSLQERLSKGVAYFKEHLSDILDIIPQLSFETDNKAINEQIKSALASFETDLFVAKACLEACEHHFSVEIYQKTKSVALLDAENLKKKSKKSSQKAIATEKEADLVLALKAWRKEKCEDLGAIAYQIMPQKTLLDIAESKPVTMFELSKIKGMGKQRIRQFGAEILEMVLKSLGQENIASAYAQHEDEEKNGPKEKKNSLEITRDFLKQCRSIEEIAEERDLSKSTIVAHVAKLIEAGDFKADAFVSQAKADYIREYFVEVGDPHVGSAKDVLGDDYSYDEIRLVLAELKHDGAFDQERHADEGGFE